MIGDFFHDIIKVSSFYNAKVFITLKIKTKPINLIVSMNFFVLFLR